MQREEKRSRGSQLVAYSLIAIMIASLGYGVGVWSAPVTSFGIDGSGNMGLNRLDTNVLRLDALTSGRIPIAGTAGLMGDDGDLTWTGGDTLTVANVSTSSLYVNNNGKIIGNLTVGENIISNGTIGGKLGLPFYAKILEYEKSDFTYLDRCDSLTGWTTSGTVAVDSTTKIEGANSFKLTSINNALSRVTSGALTLDLTGKTLRFWLKTSDVSKVNYCQFIIGCPAGWFTINPLWPAADIPFSDNGVMFEIGPQKQSMGTTAIGGGAPSWSTVTSLKIDFYSDVGQTSNMWVDDIRIVQDQTKAMVSFRFDDGYNTVYTVAKPLMDKYGYSGIVATGVTHFNQGGGGAGSITTPQALELQANGWDFVTHSSLNYNTATASEQEADLLLNRNNLLENGFYKGARFFIPQGHNIPDYNCLSLIKQYFIGCEWQTAMEQQTIPLNDPYWLQSIPITGMNIATQKLRVDNAILTNSWITFYGHSATDFTDFDQLIDYIYSKGLKVVTLSDVFDDINLPSGYKNSGSASSTASVPTKAVTHGLAITPAAGQIMVTPTTSLGNCTSYAITAYSSTTFTITTYNATGFSRGSNIAIGWAWSKP